MLGLSAWDAWRIAMGKRGMFEAPRRLPVGDGTGGLEYGSREQNDPDKVDSVSYQKPIGKAKT
jgi:hypothetical protein